MKPKHFGIFSRDNWSSYEWLIWFLRTFLTASDVQPFYISNDSSMNFRDHVSSCKFAILYHSKKRGRINITDVTDSLYDEELEYMFRKLGREKIIVVIDDVEDSSEEEKTKILQSQPSIRKWAMDLFLVNEKEKQSLSANSKDLILTKNMKKMKKTIQPRSITTNILLWRSQSEDEEKARLLPENHEQRDRRCSSNRAVIGVLIIVAFISIVLWYNY
ncbi:uncharacterized protein O3C94_018562 [Discoglossus pictus]